MRAIIRTLTMFGVHEQLLTSDVKHVRLCNIIAAVTALFCLCALPMGGLFSLNALIAPFYGVTLLLNRHRRYLAARLYLGLLGILGMTANAVLFPEIGYHVFFAVAIFLHFFLYPARQRSIMYIHASILSALFIAFGLVNHDRASVASPQYLAIVRQALLIAIPLYTAVPCGFIYVTLWRSEAEIARARAEADRLLLNVLPPEIADRLKAEHGPIADHHDEVTILFADIVGFTSVSASMEPKSLVALLDSVFAGLDSIADRIGLEKIKTVGDAYMVAAGIPRHRSDHASAIAEMALEIQRVASTDPVFGNLHFRIGFHTGSAIAGVIGRRKFIYDVWGDTVNTASRMESHGVAGRIHVTEQVRAKLLHEYLFEERGTIEVKGKGPMKTFFLVGRKSGRDDEKT